MTDELKQILCDLIERHGRELVREPKRLEGMLNDACAGQHRGARRVLVDAVQERVVEELLALGPTDQLEVVVRRAQQRLIANLAIAPDAARWAVQSWAVALRFTNPYLDPKVLAKLIRLANAIRSAAVLTLCDYVLNASAPNFDDYFRILTDECDVNIFESPLRNLWETVRARQPALRMEVAKALEDDQQLSRDQAKNGSLGISATDDPTTNLNLFFRRHSDTQRVLVDALEIRFVDALALGPSDQQQQIVENLATAQDVARCAIEAWADVLDAEYSRTLVCEVGSREDRVRRLDQLSQRVAVCVRCQELASTRTQIVFGAGNPEARIMFIGEAPGPVEDSQGEPFVGRPGQLLDKILSACELKRDDIYLCNILRCRPPNNRKPHPAEAANCREYLDGQITIIKPEFIVCLGAIAAQSLMGTDSSIELLRGRFFQYGPAKVLCTYHPNYLLRNSSKKKDCWEDMKLLLNAAGLPVPSPANDKFVNTNGMTFNLLPAGEFLMGSSDSDVRYYRTVDRRIVTSYWKTEQPQHRVIISQPFYMAIHEVTQAQYKNVIGRNPSGLSEGGEDSREVMGLDTSQFPVENVSWFDAVEFCVKLSIMENRTACYRLTNVERDEDDSITSAEVTMLTGEGYRLPTEAEWEYACRAGTTTRFHCGSELNSEEANTRSFVTTTVGSYNPNAFGLYDMHGNVCEWCQDWYDESYYALRVEHDPTGPSTGTLRVNRGGCWGLIAPRFARSAFRSSRAPGERISNVGFRIMCVSRSAR